MPTPRWLAPLFRTRTRPIVTRANKSRLRAEELEARDVPALAVAGAAPGEMPLVRVFDNNSLQTVGLFAAMPLDFRGGINATLGDVNNDGKSEVIVATASGSGPAFVRVFDISGNEIRTLPPIPIAGGLNVTSGDVSGDGNDDIIVSTVRGGLVGAFDGTNGNLMGVIAPYGADFFGGVQVAVGDVDGDGIDDIVTAPEAGGALVKAFRGITLEEFRTYDAAAGYTGPLNLAAGDVDNDGIADILLGTGTGVVPAAGIINGRTGSLDSLFVVPVNASGGMTVGVGEDANGDGVAEILLGVGGTPAVVSISPTTNGVNAIGLLPGGLVDGGLISDRTPTGNTPTGPTDVNDAPVIDGGATAGATVSEGSTAVATIGATDADLGTALTYSIAGGADAASFAIDPSTGALTFLTAPDFENPTDANLDNSYEVTVRVSDGVLSDEQNFTVVVANINDNGPIITNPPSFGADENTTAVTTVTATDRDPGTTLTYSIAGGADATSFAIDPSTGVLTFLTAPDFENPADAGADNTYDLSVRASDGELSDLYGISVTVANVNDNAPDFARGFMVVASIDEGTTAVETIGALDADGDALTYSIAGGDDAGAFSIDPSTGALTFLVAPDFENPTDANVTNNQYAVLVEASDGTNTATLFRVFNVQNVNDTAPMLFGGDESFPEVDENTTAVDTIGSFDADGDALTYSIVGGDDAGSFSIDPNTGELTFNFAPDFEEPGAFGGDNTYEVTVQVSDGTFTDTQDVFVTVANLNDSNPFISSDGGNPTASIGVSENTTAVTTVVGGDADGPTTFTYSIFGGADSSLFAIDPNTGVLTFLTAPDFESPTDAGADNTYDVIVQVSDGLNTGTQAIAVQILDAGEATNQAPVLTVPTGPIMAQTNTDPNEQEAALPASVTDADAGSGILAVTVSVSSPDGELRLSTAFGATFIGSNIGQSISFTGTLQQVNDTLATLMLFGGIPAFGQTMTVTYTVNDQGNSGSGGPLSDTDGVDVMFFFP